MASHLKARKWVRTEPEMLYDIVGKSSDKILNLAQRNVHTKQILREIMAHDPCYTPSNDGQTESLRRFRGRYARKALEKSKKMHCTVGAQVERTEVNIG